jgi:hypothetical protein
LDNVAWTNVAGGKFLETGATARLRCGRRARLTVANDGAASQLRQVAAADVCRAIDADPSLLRASPPAPCSDLRYWDATVRVSGAWHGHRGAFAVATCSPLGDQPADAAQRWAHVLGMTFVGPDPQ